MSIEDFTARRRAIVAAREEAKAEHEFEYEIACSEREFDAWVERERIKRERYEEVMAEKRGGKP